jgi:hypothetical protein
MNNKFIKFQKIVLNTRFIQKIIIKENAYEIHMKQLEKSGTIIAGSGSFQEEPEILTINKGEDYDILKKYLNSYSFR